MEVSEDQLQLSTLESDLIIDQCQMSSKQHLWRMVFTTVQKVLHEIGSDATDTQVVEAVWFELGRDDLPDSTIREAIAFAKSQSPSTQPSQGKQGELPKALPSNSQGLYSSPPHNQQSMDMMGSPAQQESVHATPWRLRGQQQTITDKSNLSNLVFSTPPPGVSQIGSTSSFETSSLWFDSEKTRKNTIYSNFSTPMRLSAAFSLLSNSIDSSGSSRFSQEQQSPLHATGFSIPHENSFDQINNKRFFEFSLDHLNYCYGAVAYYLTFEKHLPYPNNLASSRICFIVEWRDIQYKVIGHAVVIPPISLRAALGPFAVQAALQAKASLETLNKMTLRITEISYLRIIKDVSEWIFEEQGIIIYFDYEGNRYSSVLMPSTINFSKWSKNEAVIEAVRRSKFFGRIELVLPRVRLIAFKTNFILFRNTPSLKVWRVPSEKWSHGHILKLDHK